ncbi:3'-5' exonuclease [Algiphilus sp.]|uniref:3'-5' exonuclease n=1 Tax=Algiphilus sp. TaxID=1872431 RepID=UPI0025BCBAD3|nr:exonuclease domain-containing protein [Algiphilus sp.]MCK5768910.1 hypothetical protein [Algiphilus sp.]
MTLSALQRTVLLACAWCTAMLAGSAVLAWLALAPATRAVVAGDARAGLLALLALAAVGASCAGIAALLRPHIGTVPRVAYALDVIRETNPSFRLTREAPRELVRAVNALAEHHQYRMGTVENQIREATDQLADERDLLAALLAQMRDPVLVCADDGRILLYNPPARELLSGEQAAFVGLGRSVFTLFRRSIILHCLDRLADQRARDGERASVAAIISTRDGRFLRARFSPLQQGHLNGFFLSLAEAENVAGAPVDGTPTSGDRAREALVRLTGVRAAVELLRDYPDMSAAERDRFVALLDAESGALEAALQQDQRVRREALRARLPLEEIPAETLCAVVQRRVMRGVEADVPVTVAERSDWIRADSYALAAAVRFVAGRVRADLGGAGFRLHLHRGEQGHAALDLAWDGSPVPPEHWRHWAAQPVQAGDGALPYSLAEVARRHDGESWPGADASVRWLLPLATPPEHQPAGEGDARDTRPEFYDFNLFDTARAAGDLSERPLRELICTAFDTETTGLEPAAGDEIIALGAIRVVNGRILSQEVFESFVASRRPIAPNAQQIHGITPSMLRDAPAADTVLPRFADFCEDTVLLAHNGAFDLSFLSRQGAPFGLAFRQPVLDTLLLSAVLYPEREGHALEAIAERVGVSVVGRHTALGDAIVTAEIFVRLIPLLESRGIETLGDALSASQETWYARLRY